MLKIVYELAQNVHLNPVSIRVRALRRFCAAFALSFQTKIQKIIFLKQEFISLGSHKKLNWFKICTQKIVLFRKLPMCCLTIKT